MKHKKLWYLGSILIILISFAINFGNDLQRKVLHEKSVYTTKNYHMLLMINDIKYQEVLIVPSLNMEVPVAENTNDAVYQFGAGMLVKRKIDSNSNIIIGAHNLGSFSKALFSPLANNKLIDREVFITDFKLVKEYKIESVHIIFPTQVNLALNSKSNFLTMLTCTNDNKKRILVRATLRKTYKFSKVGSSVKTFLKRKNFIIQAKT